MREAIFPKQHPAIAASLYLKGRLLCAMAQYKEAGPLLTESLTLRRTSLGQRHPSVAQCECAIADLTLALGYIEGAEEHYDEALLLRQQFFPEFEAEANRVVWHMDVVESLGGNAALLEAKGDFLKATETYAEAITQLHRLCQTMDLFDGSHPLMVVLQVRLARIYITLNKVSEAKHLLKSAGDVVYGKLGDRHLVAVELHLALGLLCNHEGWYRDAQESYSKARKVLWVLFKKRVTKSPIKPKLDLKGAGIGSTADASVTTDVLTTPVDTLPERRMDYRDVDPDFTEASSDATHPLVADTLHHMAYNVGVSGPGYVKRAEELCERATEIRKGLFGKHYLDPEYDGANKGNNENNFQCTCLAASMLLRAQIAAVLREFGVAQTCFELALRISHQATGDESAHFAIVFAAYGCYLLQRAEAALHASTVSQGDPEALLEEADDTLSKALMLLRERLGDGHWLVADTMQQISFLLLYRGQVDEALALMKDGALPLFEEALGHNNPRTLFVGGCVGVTLQAAAKAALAGQGTTEGGSEVDTTHARSMSNSGHELVKSTLNFFRLYAQGAMVPTHPWVVMVGGYEVLLQKPQPKDAPSVLTGGDMSTLADDASVGGGGASVMSVDTAIDRELEEIKEDLALIPKKPELGLLFNSNASNIRDLTTSWGLE
jgi:tetratricopeptide (TPR) repeat protein